MSGVLASTIGVGVGPLVVTIAPTGVSGNCSSMGGSCMATSTSATATPTGGYQPYTFLWEFVSGDAGMTITSPTSASTTFSKTNAVAGSPTLNAVHRCTVTDGNSATAIDTVTVALTFTDST